MLMRCHELRLLGGFKAVIECDFFPVTQWGSFKAKGPWRVADWVQQLQYISDQLRCSSNHLLQEAANDKVDALAKEGVSF